MVSTLKHPCQEILSNFESPILIKVKGKGKEGEDEDLFTKAHDDPMATPTPASLKRKGMWLQVIILLFIWDSEFRNT